MTEDLWYAVQQANPDVNIQFSVTIFNQAQIEIEDQAPAMEGKNLQLSGSGQQQKKNSQISYLTSRNIAIETNYDITDLAAFMNE